ncbi:MAG TPA: adenylate/guanylate cyclase domain-containing protein [Verrucomicrobiae bacterium]|nr:adenylate/guanylate cyclase domain-containing protein [Verrucomicrobiae bacterium]
MPENADQIDTIINLHYSGLDPEIISFELDIDIDTVKKVIKNDLDRKKEKTMPIKFSQNKVYHSTIFDIDVIIKDSQVRIWNALKAKPEYETSFKDTQNILEKYGESKVNLIILHIDLVGSTRMSMIMPIDRLTTIIRSFAQQMSIIISLFGGYVLKYIGDAVLAFFIVDDKQESSIYNLNEHKDENDIYNYIRCVKDSIHCAYTMIKVIQEGINPILNQYDYPELNARIGIDFGEIAIVQYGWDIDEYEKIVFRKPHFDLIGYTISMAVKMTTLAKTNHIVLGQKLFDLLNKKEQKGFKKLQTNPDIWNYTQKTTGKIYNLYST